MLWYEILVYIAGGIGGVGGLISLYNARANKTSIDINNLVKMLDEAEKEREDLRKSHAEYVAQVDEKVDKFKKEFEDLREENRRQIMAIYSAYRCRLPEKIEDCPVLDRYVGSTMACKTCTSQKDIERNDIE